MFAINICRRSCGNKCLSGSFLNAFPTSAKEIRKNSDDSTKSPSGGKSRINKKTSNNEKKNKGKSKLYKILDNAKEASDAKAKLHKLLSEAKITDYKSSQTAANEGVKTSRPQNRKKISSKDGKGNSSQSFNRELLISARKVAQDLGGDTKQTENDIIGYLESISSRNIEKETQTKSNLDQKKAAVKVHNIISEIDKVDPHEKEKREDVFQSRPKRNYLDFSKNLGIFDEDTEWEKGPELLLWDKLEEDSLKYLALKPPRNFYEEMIQWTEEGKLWHFPIDNEQGMEEEAEISFTEHVFLEHKLEPWCPKSGPIRHFMELVLVGLSRNYHLKVKDKHEHIDWFRDYFENKRKLLTTVGAFPGPLKSTSEK